MLSLVLQCKNAIDAKILIVHNEVQKPELLMKL